MRRVRDSLQLKIPAVFIAAFLIVLIAVFGVLSTVGKRQLEEQAYRQVILTGQNIVTELGRRIAVAEALATALANLGERLPADDQLHTALIEHVIDYEGTESFIAGGGLWPEPFLYAPDRERRSFFWGRDADGMLKFYDDYNDPLGPGYHHEEWYVPAKYLKEGEAFWSKSYMDPYSYQPMVTVTVPMYRGGTFYGVSTIDLKLEGLHAMLEEFSRSFGGYAFAVDRNGKFLSFPDERLTKVYGTDAQGERTEEFINVDKLAADAPRFAPLAAAVREAIDSVRRVLPAPAQAHLALAQRIAEDSYQIDEPEARLIAAVIADMQGSAQRPPLGFQQLRIEDDLQLNESAFAAVFHMPGTYWKIVTVMPYSRATATADVIYRDLLSYTAVAMLLALGAILMLVRRILVRPITDMSMQLRALSGSADQAGGYLDTADRGELGELAHWFNERSKTLYEVQAELRQAREGLEMRVALRTEELRAEIEKRKRLQATAEQHAERVERQHAAIVSLSLHETLFSGDLYNAVRLIDETAAAAIGVARASVWLMDDQVAHLALVDLYEASTGTHTQNEVLQLVDCPEYLGALDRGRSIAVADVFSDPRTIELAGYARANGITSLLDSPIRVGGKLRGVVCFEQVGTNRVWHDDEIRFAGEIADQIVQVLTNAERLKSEEQIRKLAFFDPLTGLPNRRLLLEGVAHELEVARRHGSFGSLLFLDLDNFKNLNDSLGHHVGDELLAQVAERLRATLRKEDTASRIGGDEFVVLISSDGGSRAQAREQALTVAQKIKDVLGRPFHLHGYEHSMTSSIGITIYSEDHETAVDVLKQADTAMYRAKGEGKNTISFYSPEMQKAADLRLTVEKELRVAISDGQFTTFFQPKVDAEGSPLGAEALVRWYHPEQGIVTPAEFIPIAEETGLILEIGEWVLADVCAFLAQSPVDHMAVNISPRQFRQQDFVVRVFNTLERTGIDPSRLIFELTESVVVENFEDTALKMRQLRDAGIRFAIDDFGTGYSSLAYLKRLPLDQLKINDHFVRDITTDPNDAVIVETIISMAQHLGLNVVAEGVETEQQLAFLVRHGCKAFQGYHFSRPLSRAGFEQYLAVSPQARLGRLRGRAT